MPVLCARWRLCKTHPIGHSTTYSVAAQLFLENHRSVTMYPIYRRTSSEQMPTPTSGP